MNIIKLKDVIMPGETEQVSFFNKHLKGKYAYWVQMRYIVSFDHMRHEGYIACEEDITKLLPDSNGVYPQPYGAPSFDVYDESIIPYIDQRETDRINSIMEYRLKNKYTPDDDITIDELKKFRTWLATELLAFDLNPFESPSYILFDESQTHVLSYYSNNMYDNTIKILSEFGNETVEYIEPGVTPCSCKGSNLSSLYNTDLHICDPISIYRSNIKSKMIDMFSDINFWTRFAPEFILEIKKYIDNIIRVNLPLYLDTLNDKFVDCGCKENNDKQKWAIEILNRLSTSLEYIYKGEIIGHKNYISDSLRDWSNYLYEIMYW